MKRLAFAIAVVLGGTSATSAVAGVVRTTCAYFVAEGDDVNAASVIAGQSDDKFKPIDCENSAFGFDPRPYWVQVDFLRDPTTTDDVVVEVGYTALDHVTFYQQTDHGLRIVESGDMLPFSSREVFHRTFVFDHALLDRPLYIKVETDGSVQIPIRAFSAVTFAEKSTTEFGSMGLYYGILLAMILYNAFLFLVIRDFTYLFYVLYVACYGGFQASLNGVGFMYLWPNAVTWNNFSIPILIAAMFAFMFLFTIRFLDTARRTPILHRTLQFWLALSVAATIVAPFVPLRLSIKSIVLFSIFAAVVVLVAGINSVVSGYKPARYFLIAWSTFLLGIVTISFKNFGILPANFVTDYGMQIGSALETVLLSMGLGYRIRQAEDERAQALLSAQRIEQEAARDRAVAQTTQMLAHDVRRPFTMLSGILTTLNETKDPIETQKVAQKFVPEVEKALTNVKGMIQDVMEVGREAELAQDVVALDGLIRSSIKVVLMSFGSDIPAIEYDLEPGLAVFGDQQRLTRAMCNVIANAIEATGTAGQIWVRSHLDAKSREVRVTIGNTGEPIDESIGSRLFEAFTSIGKTNGTGLGLAIAHKIVSKHRGRIWYKATSEGTEFYLALPGVHLSTPSNAATVVVVDDCAWARAEWQRRAAGSTELFTFASPREAQDALNTNFEQFSSADFVVDFHFDRGSETGPQFAQWLRASGCVGNIYLSSERDDVSSTDLHHFSGRLPKNVKDAAADLLGHV